MKNGQEILYSEVLELFNHRCGLNPSHKYQHIHHIFPRGVGGKDELENLIPLCAVCHGKIHREGTRKWRKHLEEIIQSRIQRKGFLGLV